MVYTFYGLNLFIYLTINILNKKNTIKWVYSVNHPNKKSKRCSFAFFVISSLDSCF